MNRTAAILAGGLMVMGLASMPLPAASAERAPKPVAVPKSAIRGNPMVVIAYGEPANPQHVPVHDRLRQREVLEELQKFLAPLRLPRPLTVEIKTCKRANAFYSRGAVTICYEYIERIRQRAPVKTTAEGVTHEDAVVAGFVSVTLHEVAHAVFDMLQIPVFGREEDAADQLAAFIMLQFGKDVARRLIAGKAHLWQSAAAERKRPRGNRDYADVHGTEYQRFYNILCLAYGHDPQTFRDYVKTNILPAARARRCRTEHARAQRAFRALLLPHIDRALMEQVRQIEWLRPDDGRP